MLQAGLQDCVSSIEKDFGIQISSWTFSTLAQGAVVTVSGIATQDDARLLRDMLNTRGMLSETVTPITEDGCWRVIAIGC